MNNIKSDHNKFEIRSLEMKQFMDNVLEELKAFHEFALENNLEYTLRGGSALGYLLIRSYLPWDDDIDICYKDTDYEKILNLWNSGINKENIWKDNNWEFKQIIINNKNFYLARCIHTGVKKITNPYYAFKLIQVFKNENLKNRNDLGGLDIFPQSFHPPKNIRFEFQSKPNIVIFSGVETMILEDKIYFDNLCETFGKPNGWGKYVNLFSENEKRLRDINIKNLNKKYNFNI